MPAFFEQQSEVLPGSNYIPQPTFSRRTCGNLACRQRPCRLDFSGQDFTDVRVDGSSLTDADLAGAIVTGADFSHTIGFAKQQLYSTVSYQRKNLQESGYQQTIYRAGISAGKT